MERGVGGTSHAFLQVMRSGPPGLTDSGLFHVLKGGARVYIYMGVCIGDHHPRDVRDRGSPAGAVEAGIIPWGCEVQPGSLPAGMCGVTGAALGEP